MASIQSSVAISSVVIFGLIGGVAGTGIWAVRTLTSSSVELSKSAEILRNHMQADMMHDALRADVLASILAANPAAGFTADSVKKDLGDHESLFREMIEKNKAIATNVDTQKVLASVEGPLLDYIQSATNLVDLASKNSDSALIALPEFMEKFSTLEVAMAQVGDKIQSATKNKSDEDTDLQRYINLILEAALGIAALFSLGLYFMTRRNISSPILALCEDMNLLAGGKTDIACTGIGRTDEIGTMASAVEVFRQGAIDNRRLEQEADTARKRMEIDRIAAQEAAERDAAARLKIATSGLAVGLKRLASGDLAFQLEERFSEDFEELRLNFNQSVKQLGDTLSAISSAITAFDDGTREISSGANDLSKRTEHQAASLEQTAAALDQITASVSNSSKRTDEARASATEANHSAIKSAQVVSSAEEAMRRIEASSQQISNIISVIDEIAFQTNLLALNAGVEAARAGDAGKGFAVVAQEVRELAQRSATAAKEIKGHIQKSSEEVDSGVKLVLDTGLALNTIGKQIAQINEHMNIISTSAKEQSTGIAEVNAAINTMDQTTQQNAAMVEQSTAALANLAMEAAKLRSLVQQFKLQSSVTDGVPSSRKSA